MMVDSPSDFNAYWQTTLADLAAYPPSAQIDPIPLRSTDFATMYGVRLTSIGPYRIFAYLSIPKSKGPFPAIYYVPRYQSVVQPAPQGTAAQQRGRYITLALAARGFRNADKPFAASFPGLLTEGIESEGSYVFRGIIADCVRGLDFLLTQPGLDPARVVVVGNDLALITAALHSGATHAVATPELFSNTVAAAAQTMAYPLEEINDYLRLYPESRKAVSRTLSYFDLLAFAPRIHAKTLIMAGAKGSLLDAGSLAPLGNAIEGTPTIRVSERSSYKDGLFAETWIAEQCGITGLGGILPEAWQYRSGGG